MKKIIIVFILCVLCGDPCFPMDEGLNYDRVYESLSVVKNDFVNSEDPDEYFDYKEFIRSPYPLIRTWSDLYFKNSTIPQGYYLLNPRKKDGIDVVMFKQNGKISYIIPVFEKKKIDPLLVYKISPAPKTPWYKIPGKLFNAGMSKILGKYKKPPESPKSLLKTSYIGNSYFEIDFYYEDYLYKILLKTEK